MTKGAAKAAQASLPPLSGGLLWSYRIAWCAFTAGALLASGFSLLQPGSHPAVFALRLAKSLVLVSVSAVLIYRRQRDPVASLLALAFLTWTITSSFDFGTDAELAQLLDRGRFLLFALALLLFPEGRWQPGWTRWTARASVAVFLIGVGEGVHLLPTKLFVPLAILCVLAAVVSLIARFRSTSNYELKQQLKWVALGLIAGVGLILCARAGAALSTRSIRAMPILWEGMFQVGIIIVALGFLVSLLRYRLFDAEAVISRSAAYAALTIAVVATFGGTEGAIENLGQSYLGMNVGSISGAMAAAVAALLLSPLHGRISKWAEDRFQPDLAQLKREMPELLAFLSEASSIRRASAAVLPHINAAIHATRSALILDGRVPAASGVTVRDAQRWWRDAIREQGPLVERNVTDPLFPVRLSLGTAPSGSAIWLLLGPRPDTTLYGGEDLAVVRSTLPALKHALTAAIARERLAAAVSRRERRLRNELNEIRARLGDVEVEQGKFAKGNATSAM
jgi:hypothetical protein